MKRKLILKNGQAPGDILMLTAAVRDLHHCYPGKFLTDVRTPSPALWKHNPLITPLSETDPGIEIIECHYPLIHTSNHLPYHFIFGFIEFLNEKLDLKIKPTDFRGAVYLAPEERRQVSQIEELTGQETKYWLINAGGKWDFTAKWWAPERYQEVVDHFKGRIQFVQIGSANHYHPDLKGVINLVGKTDLRQLVRLFYHAAGVLTPVSLPMHLSRAVPPKPGQPLSRPCVVIAGGREPTQWEAYSQHQFLHTVGALPCCATGGCWKSRVVKLHDGDPNDQMDKLCVNVVGNLPKCMDMITSADVIRAIEQYYVGGVLAY